MLTATQRNHAAAITSVATFSVIIGIMLVVLFIKYPQVIRWFILRTHPEARVIDLELQHIPPLRRQVPLTPPASTHHRRRRTLIGQWGRYPDNFMD